jgi:hypothetical protein
MKHTRKQDFHGYNPANPGSPAASDSSAATSTGSPASKSPREAYLSCDSQAGFDFSGLDQTFFLDYTEELFPTMPGSRNKGGGKGGTPSKGAAPLEHVPATTAAATPTTSTFAQTSSAVTGTTSSTSVTPTGGFGGGQIPPTDTTVGSSSTTRGSSVTFSMFKPTTPITTA